MGVTRRIDRVVVHRRRAEVGVVADEHHDRSVRPATNRMRAVIAHAVRRVPRDPFDRVHHVVAVRILQLVEAGDAGVRLPAASAATATAAGGRLRTCRTAARSGRACRRAARRSRRRRERLRIAVEPSETVGVERRAVIEQTVTGVQPVGDDLLAFEHAVAVRVNQESRRAAVARHALADDWPALTVEGHDDVGLGFLDGIDAVHTKTRQRGEWGAGRRRVVLRPVLGHRGGWGLARLCPRRDANYSGHRDGATGNESKPLHSNLRKRREVGRRQENWTGRP